jgi:eukaryotic-like serine/threonine-protein kinase
VRGGYYGRYATDGHLLYIRQHTLYAAPMNPSRLELTGPVVPVLENVDAYPFMGFASVEVTRNGMLVYAKRRSRTRLAWFDTAGHTESLQLSPGWYYDPQLSPDGKRLAVGMMTASGDWELWVHELARGSMTRLTFARGADENPVWSPDGNHIVFSSERHGGLRNLYWMRSDGGGPAVRLTNSPDAQEPTSFTPDGRHLLYAQVNPPNHADLWRLTFEGVHGDRPTVSASEPFLQTPFDEDHATVSPDGRWVAYESTESGRRDVYVRPFAGQTGKWAVSTSGGSRPG